MPDVEPVEWVVSTSRYLDDQGKPLSVVVRKGEDPRGTSRGVVDSYGSLREESDPRAIRVLMPPRDGDLLGAMRGEITAPQEDLGAALVHAERVLYAWGEARNRRAEAQTVVASALRGVDG